MGVPDKDELARNHQSLVEAISLREHRKFAGEVSLEDIRSFANEGLAIAIHRFDPSREVAFKTFAGHRIRGAIYDGIAASQYFPRRLRRKIAFYKKSEELLAARADEPPPRDQVEAVHRLADNLKELVTAYITEFGVEEENTVAGEQAQQDVAMECRQFREKVRSCIEQLPSKQREVIRLYFFEDLVLSEVGEKMGITKSWASKILSGALAKLRRLMEDASLPASGCSPVPL